MFRTLSDPPSSWELSLPPELLRLPEELTRVGALLDDPAFFAPYFHPVLGPSTPVECYLRLCSSNSGTSWALRACALR